MLISPPRSQSQELVEPGYELRSSDSGIHCAKCVHFIILRSSTLGEKARGILGLQESQSVTLLPGWKASRTLSQH